MSERPVTPVTIVTFTDTRYFPLFRELVRSIRRHKGPDDIHISVFTADLSDAQQNEARALAQNVREADWNFDYPWLRKLPAYRMARTCAPFVPRDFPGYATYVWIDADAWVADWSSVELLIEGAAKGALAIAPEIDRAYAAPVGGLHVHWLFDRPVYVRSYMYKNAKHAFGRKVARAVALNPVLNAGVYALRQDAPHWDAWRACMNRFLATGRLHGDQISLNLPVYLEGLKAELLPATCNWLAIKAMPLFDTETQRFVEPYLPHRPIGIMHLVGFHEMRMDPACTVEVRNLDGTTARRSLRFQG